MSRFSSRLWCFIIISLAESLCSKLQSNLLTSSREGRGVAFFLTCTIDTQTECAQLNACNNNSNRRISKLNLRFYTQLLHKISELLTEKRKKKKLSYAHIGLHERYRLRYPGRESYRCMVNAW
uniref:Putative secreted protein n=1 Tax=Amblyomma triste TaxID=251400 RepID=A0A023G277_AMBTT